MLKQTLREFRSLYAHTPPRKSSKLRMPASARTITSPKYTGRPAARGSSGTGTLPGPLTRRFAAPSPASGRGLSRKAVYDSTSARNCREATVSIARSIVVAARKSVIV